MCGFAGAYAVGWLIGRLSLHLLGDYFIIATLGLAFLALSVFTNWGSVTGGTQGRFGIPRPTFGPYVLNSNGQLLILSAGLLLCVFVLAWVIVGSPFGRLLHAVRDDPTAVSAIGYDPARLKRSIFALSAGLSGLAGVVYATYITYIDPSSFQIDPLILIVGMVVIGGAGTIVGALIGGLIVFLTPELLRHLQLADSTNSSFTQNAIFGFLLIVVVIVRPEGILSEPLIERWRGLRGRAGAELPSDGESAEAPGSTSDALQEPAASIDPGKTAVVESRLRVEGAEYRVEIRNVSKSFGGNRVVDDVTLTLEPGKVTSIIGPNGAGKTTLLSCIAGSQKPDGGSILVAGQEVAGLPAHRVVARGVARTFQDARLFGRMTVRENVNVGFRRRSGQTLFSAVTRLRSTRRESETVAIKTQDLLEWVTLDHLADREARQLSGGQRMLVSLVRTMATNSKVILLDEPTAGVAPTLIPRITAFIRDLADLGHTVCLVEHRMELVKELSDWVIVMVGGKVALEGTADEAMASVELQEIYFGDEMATVG